MGKHDASMDCLRKGETKMRLKIKVTKAHIICGKQRSLRSCPIALALTTAGYEDPEVERGTVRAVYKGVRYSFSISPVGRIFIRDFDVGKTVQPLFIELEEDEHYRTRV